MSGCYSFRMSVFRKRFCMQCLPNSSPVRTCTRRRTGAILGGVAIEPVSTVFLKITDQDREDVSNKRHPRLGAVPVRVFLVFSFSLKSTVTHLKQSCLQICSCMYPSVGPQLHLFRIKLKGLLVPFETSIPLKHQCKPTEEQQRVIDIVVRKRRNCFTHDVAEANRAH